MRFCAFVLLMTVLCLGCNRAEEARRKAVQNNLRQIGEALKNYHETYESKFSHVIVAETEILHHPQGFCRCQRGRNRSGCGHRSCYGSLGGTHRKSERAARLPCRPSVHFHDSRQSQRCDPVSWQACRPKQVKHMWSNGDFLPVCGKGKSKDVAP